MKVRGQGKKSLAMSLLIKESWSVENTREAYGKQGNIFVFATDEVTPSYPPLFPHGQAGMPLPRQPWAQKPSQPGNTESEYGQHGKGSRGGPLMSIIHLFRHEKQPSGV